MDRCFFPYGIDAITVVLKQGPLAPLQFPFPPSKLKADRNPRVTTPPGHLHPHRPIRSFAMAQYNGKPYQPRQGLEHPLQPAEDPEVHATDAVINHLAVTAAEADTMNAYKEEHGQEVEESEGDGQLAHGEHGGNGEAILMDAEAAVAAAATAAATQLDLHRAMVSTIVPPPSSRELHPVHAGRSMTACFMSPLTRWKL